MKELVFLKRGKIFCDSIMFSEKFEMNHRNVLKDIRNLTATAGAMKNEFKEVEWVNERNRSYPKFLMTRKGFMFLTMNTNVKPERKKRLYEVQEKIISAFDEMELLLLKRKNNQENLEWKKSREQGKEIRTELTDTIKDFVEYATSQGSKSANRYFGNITKMQYKALSLIQQKNIKIKDVLDSLELYQLILADELCKNRLKFYMSEKLHYKEIYILVKQDIENFAKALMIGN